jgi:hypothetical protein
VLEPVVAVAQEHVHAVVLAAAEASAAPRRAAATSEGCARVVDHDAARNAPDGHEVRLAGVSSNDDPARVALTRAAVATAEVILDLDDGR